MEIALHVFCIILKLICALFIKDLTLAGVDKSVDESLIAAIIESIKGKSSLPYTIEFIAKAIGACIFLMVSIFTVCEYIDQFERFILSLR